MDAEHDTHELAAAYALDALDDSERREFEAHLGDCEDCADEVESLRGAATALAYATAGPAPPPELRARLLERARAERAGTVVTLPARRRLALPAVAAVAACAAIAFGVWAATLSSDLSNQQSVQQKIVGVLSTGTSIPLAGQTGRLVVAPSGTAVLDVSGLDPAPAGKTYEAWVVGSAQRPLPAGLFRGGDDAVVLLSRDVPPGTRVAVTLERAGGVDAPTGRILFATRQAV